MMDLISNEELGRLEAPSSVDVQLRANLAGVGVRVTLGPGARDPLGQRGTTRHFETLAEAVTALPDIVRDHLREHHAEAEARRSSERQG